MLKLMGSALLVLCGLGMGLRKAASLSERCRVVLETGMLLKDLQIRVSFEAQPLERLIAEARSFHLCDLAMDSPKYPEDPKGALREAGSAYFRDKSDRALFEGFLRGLGESGLREQLEHLKLYESLFARQLISAREARDKRTRLCVCLGVFGGVLCCLVLL